MPTGNLLVDSQFALNLTQRGLAEALGSSRRTGQRWSAGQSYPAKHQLEALAGLLYPIDQDLAGKAARAAGKTLEELGLVVASPLQSPPLPWEYVVDSVVCVAAETAGLMPGAMRLALLAALARARLLGLSVDVMETALRGTKEPAQTAAKRAKK